VHREQRKQQGELENKSFPAVHDAQILEEILWRLSIDG